MGVVWIERLEAGRSLMPDGGEAGRGDAFSTFWRTHIASRAGTPLRELFAFVAIGGGAALSYVALSGWMVSAATAVPAWLVSAICYAAFIVPVYLLHRRFTFRSDTRHSEALPRYVVVQLSALLLATIFSYLCYAVLGIGTWVAAALVIVLTSAVNFVVLKLWAFARR
jgi:putative flippase GtrA